MNYITLPLQYALMSQTTIKASLFIIRRQEFMIYNPPSQNWFTNKNTPPTYAPNGSGIRKLIIISNDSCWVKLLSIILVPKKFSDPINLLLAAYWSPKMQFYHSSKLDCTSQAESDDEDQPPDHLCPLCCQCIEHQSQLPTYTNAQLRDCQLQLCKTISTSLQKLRTYDWLT